MELGKVKELTARTFDVGIGRVRIVDPDKAREAITKDDIRNLVRTGAIEILQKRGTSRARARILEKKRKKGERRGPGKRKGKKTARKGKKETWMEKVRALRRLIKELRDKKGLEDYRKVYRMIKSGYFKSKKHLLSYLRGVR